MSRESFKILVSLAVCEKNSILHVRHGPLPAHDMTQTAALAIESKRFEAIWSSAED